MSGMHRSTKSFSASLDVVHGAESSKVDVIGGTWETSGSSRQVQARSLHSSRTNPSPVVCRAFFTMHSALAEQDPCTVSVPVPPPGDRTCRVCLLPCPAWSTQGDEMGACLSDPASTVAPASGAGSCWICGSATREASGAGAMGTPLGGVDDLVAEWLAATAGACPLDAHPNAQRTATPPRKALPTARIDTFLVINIQGKATHGLYASGRHMSMLLADMQGRERPP